MTEYSGLYKNTKGAKALKRGFREKYIGDNTSIEATIESNLMLCAFQLNKEYKKDYIVSFAHDSLGDFIKFSCKKDKNYSFVIDIWYDYNEIGLAKDDGTIATREVKYDFSDVLPEIRDLLHIYGDEILY